MLPAPLCLQTFVDEQLGPTWEWMVAIMDSTEAQLRFGSALSNSSDPSCPQHPLHSNHVRTNREPRSVPRDEPRPLQVIDTRRRHRFGAIGKAVVCWGRLVCFFTLGWRLQESWAFFFLQGGCFGEVWCGVQD